MSQIKHKILENKLPSNLLESDDEALQAILRAVISVQHEAGFGSIEITVHEGRVTQIEKREKIRIIQDKSEKQSLNKLSTNKPNINKQDLNKQGTNNQSVETLSLSTQKRELTTALHN